MALPNQNLRILGVDEAYILTDNAGTVVETRLHFINQANFTTDIATVDFQGDQTQERVYLANGFSVELVCDKYDLTALGIAFNKTDVTTGLPVGVASRVYFGESAETAGATVGMKFVVRSAVDNVANTTKQEDIVVPVGTLSALEPPNLSYNGKGQMRLRLSATKTTVDIAGDALPGGPTDGATWYMDRHS